MTSTSKSMTNVVLAKKRGDFLIDIFFPFIRHDKFWATVMRKNLSAEGRDHAVRSFILARRNDYKASSCIDDRADSNVSLSLSLIHI